MLNVIFLLQKPFAIEASNIQIQFVQRLCVYRVVRNTSERYLEARTGIP